MDRPNQWLPQPKSEDLTYMYDQEEHPGIQHQLAEQPLQEQEHLHQFYAASSMANPFHASHSSSGFPSFRDTALPGLTFGALATSNSNSEQVQPSPSGILSFGGQAQASTFDFSAGAWQQDGVEAAGMHQAPDRRTRAPGIAQEHVMAERKRREKLQQQFVALATIVPGLKKTDKISLLGSTIDYVKQLEEKVKALEEHSTRRTATVFESKCCISADGDGSGPSGSASGADGPSPTVEASVRGSTVLLKISCKERRGVLVMVISELENRGLSILNTSVVPFADSCLNITITAKIEEGFSTAVELVENLTMALRSFN